MKIPDFERGYFSPRRGDRRRLRDLSDALIADAVISEHGAAAAGEKLYDVYDSPLETGTRPGEYSYSFTFSGFAPEGETFKEYVQSNLPQQAIGIDIGGPGRALFRGFDRGVFKATYGMTLVDPRDMQQRIEDEQIGHDIIPGDFREKWGALSEKLGGEKANIVFARPVGGYLSLPQDPYAFAEEFNKAYQIVSEDRGQMYVSVPKIMEPVLLPWAMEIQDKHADHLGVDVAQGMLDFQVELEKLPGAPENIPMLSARDVRRHYEKAFEGRPKYITVQGLQERHAEEDARMEEERPEIEEMLRQQSTEQREQHELVFGAGASGTEETVENIHQPSTPSVVFVDNSENRLDRDGDSIENDNDHDLTI